MPGSLNGVVLARKKDGSLARNYRCYISSCFGSHLREDVLTSSKTLLVIWLFFTSSAYCDIGNNQIQQYAELFAAVLLDSNWAGQVCHFVPDHYDGLDHTTVTFAS